jgi:Sarcosine oxidase A3 domain
MADARRRARGASGPNQLKAFTRCGMGPCQGRICGPVVSAVIADVLGKSMAEIGIYRPRAPFKPITVGALADRGIGENQQEIAEASPLGAPHPPVDAGFSRCPLAGRGPG